MVSDLLGDSKSNPIELRRRMQDFILTSKFARNEQICEEIEKEILPKLKVD
jgi:hypothetical protein